MSDGEEVITQLGRVHGQPMRHEPQAMWIHGLLISFQAERNGHHSSGRLSEGNNHSRLISPSLLRSTQCSCCQSTAETVRIYDNAVVLLDCELREKVEDASPANT